MTAEIRLTQKGRWWQVCWSVGSIDTYSPVASEAFKERLAASGFLERIDALWCNSVSLMSRTAVLDNGVRWGSVKGLPESVARRIHAEVERSYREAAADLPTRISYAAA